MLGAPRPTPYDLNFTVFGFPVRVSAWFWLAGFIFGSSAGPKGVFAFIIAMFLSILVHELGHTFAFRRYGVDSSIVLHHFGGLAIPRGAEYGGYSTRRNSEWQNLVIAAAGPILEIASTVPLIALQMVLVRKQISLGFLDDVMYFYIYVSIFWGLMNLAPVFPLDGGRIARSLFLLAGDSSGVQHSLMLSTVIGGIIAAYGLMNGMQFLGFMFGFLAYQSYQSLEGIGGGYGGRGF